MRYAFLLVPLLALFALACNGGGEAQPTATAEPDATATYAIAFADARGSKTRPGQLTFARLCVGASARDITGR